MMIPIEPAEDTERTAAFEKGFAIVAEEPPGSPRERFERRAEQIARAAELGVRQMMDAESELVGAVPADRWNLEAERTDAVPFALRRRVVLRVPVFERLDAAEPPEEVLLSDDLGRSGTDVELRRVRALMARLALDLIAQVIEISRYFAETGYVKAPEDFSQPRGSGNTMSEGSDGFSFRRRA